MLKKLCQTGVILALMPLQAWAADGSWLNERFDVTVRDQSLRDVIEQFGTMVGIPTLVSERVDAVVSAKFVDATGRDILDEFTKRYALDWRFDGRRLEVSANSEQVSRVLSMSGVLQSELVEALKGLDAYDSRYPLSAIDGQLALLTGPPRYVAIVEIVLAELAENRSVELEEARVLRAQKLEDERARLKNARKLEQIRAEALARAARTQIRVRNNGPVINRGGRWGG